MPRAPTVVIRIPATQAEAAQSATGLPQGPAVRACLAAGIGQEDRLLTLEEAVRILTATMEQLQAAVRVLEEAYSRNPPPDMPPAPNGATMAVEAENG